MPCPPTQADRARVESRGPCARVSGSSMGGRTWSPSALPCPIWESRCPAFLSSSPNESTLPWKGAAARPVASAVGRSHRGASSLHLDFQRERTRHPAHAKPSRGATRNAPSPPGNGKTAAGVRGTLNTKRIHVGEGLRLPGPETLFVWPAQGFKFC